MAKISPILGGMSGSIAGNTFAHNRGGQYVRQRSIPVNPTSTKQSAIRNLLGIQSGLWFGLTQSQRDAWENYASLNPVVDSLGQAVQLTGHQCFVGANSRLAQAGDPLATDPPITTGPDDVDGATATLTAPGTIAIAFTTTPLGAGVRLAVWATLPALASINPNRRQARLIGISAAATASPQTFASPYPAVAGQASNLWVAVQDDQGLVSPGLRVRQTWV